VKAKRKMKWMIIMLMMKMIVTVVIISLKESIIRENRKP
jgi:hypothetical protein